MMYISLSNSTDVALVDDEEFVKLCGYNWQKSSNGYAIRSVGTSKIYMHQDVLPTSKGVYADHIDSNRLNNQKSNLRPATHSENGQRRKVQSNSRTGYRGVIHSPHGWRAHLYCNRKHISLGYYKDIEDAARAYDKGALQYFGPNAALNFPTEDRATC